MDLIAADDPQAAAATALIRAGDVDGLRALLHQQPGLINGRIGEACGARTLLHIATDWPGHFPDGAATVRTLLDLGADVNAPFVGRHQETPLHWAASCDDVAVLDALLDGGADIEASGGVIGGGTALDDAVAFGQWRAARRLVERGARTSFWHEAALGMADAVAARLARADGPDADAVTHAFWCACHGGQRATAELLIDSGADPDWAGYDDLTPLGAAERSEAHELVDWLRAREASD